MVAIIVAVAAGSNAIGFEGRLPWPHITSDMRRFRALTMGHPVVMGRRTFESIVKVLGHPLKGRTNIVLTRSHTRVIEDGGGIAVSSLNDALAVAERFGEPFVIGGAEVYKEALPLARVLHITTVYARQGGGGFPEDTFFDWEAPGMRRMVEYTPPGLHDPKDPLWTSYAKYECTAR